jgi:hypothetical protein
MESEQLCSFGRYLKGKLKQLGKDDEWLIKRLRQDGSYFTPEQLQSVYTGENQSRPRQAMIGVVLHDEEQRQRLKRIAGIK